MKKVYISIICLAVLAFLGYCGIQRVYGFNDLGGQICDARVIGVKVIVDCGTEDNLFVKVERD